MALAMNAEQRDELVKRLRSGKYEQGKEKLAVKGEDKDRFCCLGVLCEMAVEAGIIPRIEREVECWDCDAPEGTVAKVEVYYDNTYDATLPQRVVDWAGIESVDIDRRGDDQNYDDFEGMGRFAAEHEQGHTSLAGMNDDGVSFADIATFIEDEVEAR